MDTNIAIALITAVSALLGGMLTIFAQRNTAKSQLAQDRYKQECEEKALAHKEMQDCIAKAHRILYKISREFSLTNLDIVWRSNMTEHAYDQRYLASCELADELRAIADLHIPRIADSVDKMFGEMNIFWGNFKEVIALTHANRECKIKEPFLIKAHKAAQNLGGYVIHAKYLLAAQEQDEEI